MNQLTRLAAPAIAGWLIASSGTAIAFWCNGISVIVSIICIIIIPSRKEIAKIAGSGLKQFREEIAFFHSQKLLRLIIVFAAVQTFFGLSVVQLLPAFSTVVLKANANTLGSLIDSAGAGALVGIVIVLPFVQRIKRSCISIGGAVIWAGLWYILFSFAKIQAFRYPVSVHGEFRSLQCAHPFHRVGPGTRPTKHAGKDCEHFYDDHFRIATGGILPSREGCRSDRYQQHDAD